MAVSSNVNPNRVAQPTSSRRLSRSGRSSSRSTTSTTLPAPWEWDIKRRLAASFVVVYGESMAEFSRMKTTAKEDSIMKTTEQEQTKITENFLTIPVSSVAFCEEVTRDT
jgi:hypothetical protein